MVMKYITFSHTEILAVHGYEVKIDYIEGMLEQKAMVLNQERIYSLETDGNVWKHLLLL